MATPKNKNKPAPRANRKGGAPKGNKNAVGNKGGGQESPYKPEFAEEAYILCAEQGATDLILGEHFGVAEATIRKWRLKHVEFRAAIRAGKVETDDAVERATVQHITGYYVNTRNRWGGLAKLWCESG